MCVCGGEDPSPYAVQSASCPSGKDRWVWGLCFLAWLESKDSCGKGRTLTWNKQRQPASATTAKAEGKKKAPKVALIATYDPRLPSTSNTIKKKIFIKFGTLTQETDAKTNTEKSVVIYKPTVPNQFPVHEPHPQHVFDLCKIKRCNACNHSNTCDLCLSMGRADVKIRHHWHTWREGNVIYVLKWTEHPKDPYVGSTRNLKKR